MKKSVGIYSAMWAICLAVFNVIVFVIPREIGGVDRLDGSFWVGYCFITLAFFGQLVCAIVALMAENQKKLFYNIPLISISYGGLVTMLCVGSVFMAVPVLPEWIGVIACFCVVAFHAVAVIKAAAAADIASDIDEAVRIQTFFVKDLALDAQNLVTAATSDAVRAEAKRVYEAVRYSDPVSTAALHTLERQMEGQFAAFADAVAADDAELAKKTADAFVALAVKREQKCKMMK